MGPSRSRFLVVALAFLLVVPVSAIPALADDDHRHPGHDGREGHGHDHDGAWNAKQLKAVLKDLKAGIRALKKLGGQERALAHMLELQEGVEQRLIQIGGDRRRRGAMNEERRRLGQMIEVMMMGAQTLASRGRHEQAEVLERGAMAMRMLWQSRSDEEAMDVLARAPSEGQQAKALMAAGEVLAERGQTRRAKLFYELGKKLGAKTKRAKAAPPKKRKARKEARGELDLEELSDRVRILRMAMPALREGEKREAAELLERALRTGELLLEGREDEEAQKIFRQTPGLGELAQVLHVAAKLWLEFKHMDEAEAVARLSRYYRERDAEGRRARESELDAERQAQRDRVDPQVKRAIEERERARKAVLAERERARARRMQAERAQEQERAAFIAELHRLEDEYKRRRAAAEKRAQIETEKRGARAKGWAARQQAEMEERQRRAREAEMVAERRAQRARQLRGPKSDDARIDELRQEMNEVRQVLRELMRQLRELANDRR